MRSPLPPARFVFPVADSALSATKRPFLGTKNPFPGAKITSSMEKEPFPCRYNTVRLTMCPSSGRKNAFLRTNCPCSNRKKAIQLTLCRYSKEKKPFRLTTCPYSVAHRAFLSRSFRFRPRTDRLGGGILCFGRDIAKSLVHSSLLGMGPTCIFGKLLVNS